MIYDNQNNKATVGEIGKVNNNSIVVEEKKKIKKPVNKRIIIGTGKLKNHPLKVEKILSAMFENQSL